MKYIQLTKGKYAWVDNEDYERASQYKWQLHTGGYASKSKYIKINGKETTIIIYLHRFILDVPKDKQIDHISGDKLDNRKKNLRIVTSQQNNMNRNPNKGRKYKGVFWDKSRNKYMAMIGIGRKYKNLGRFLTEKEAALAYNLKAKELFGDFAYLNQVGGDAKR